MSKIFNNIGLQERRYREPSLPHISYQDKKRFIKMIYKWVKYSTILDSRREDIEKLPYHTFLIKIKRDL